MMSDELFNKFYDAGMRKMDPKNSRKRFDQALKQRDKQRWPTVEEFTDFLVLDVQKRINANQNGFDKLHPTTYLNNDRWLDEIVRGRPPPNQPADTVDLLFNRDWAKDLMGNQLEQEL